jgi:hypothetical protein
VTDPTFNPAYRVARCGQTSSHRPHVMEHGPDQPRNCPGTGARRNPWCSNCGDLRGGPLGHETSECTFDSKAAADHHARLAGETEG